MTRNDRGMLPWMSAKVRGMSSIPDASVDWLLDTERLRLRPVTVEDTSLMLAVWNDPAFIRNVSDRGIRTEEQAREAFALAAHKLPLKTTFRSRETEL